MQNILLLHLRSQKRLTPKQIEERTGIPAAHYTEYEQGISGIPDTHVELLATLFNMKSTSLRTYAHQLEYFSNAKSILELKEKRIEQLTAALKRYIRKAPHLKPKTLKL